MTVLEGVRKQVINIREKNLCATLQTIGDKVGVSRERVRQILDSENKPTRHWKPKHYCQRCGKELVPIHSNSSVCRNKYCSKECKTPIIQVTCSNCRKLFPKREMEVIWWTNSENRQFFFCSNKCRGIYSGEHFGFKIHPENSWGVKNKGKSKYSADVRKTTVTLKKNGASLGYISKSLLIPSGSVYGLYKKGINNGGE
jgi:hypothetical protein